MPSTPPTAMATLPMLVAGELVGKGGDAWYAVANPSTLEEVGKAPHATQAQVDAAVAAAKKAQPAWAALGIEQRKALVTKAVDIIQKHAAALGELLTAEQGKPLKMAGEEGEVSWALGLARKSVEEISLEPEVYSATVSVHRRPLGVVAGITPWNFPVFCSVQKWVPSLILGNTFVHKPSPFTPLTGLRIGELLKDVFPPGVFNVVSGDDKAAFNVGAHLSSHPQINMVSFTGSVATGKRILGACAGSMRRATVEAGGNDAAIVRADCDPKEVAPGLFAGAFANSGQICCAVKRAYVHASIYDAVVGELVKCAAKAKFGDGRGEDVEFGPLNNKMQLDKVAGLVEDARGSAGVRIECGGEKMPGHKGYFYAPTIISNVAEGVRIVDEEQFGPVLPVIKYTDDEDALQRANDSPFGLGGSVWSKDVRGAAALAARMQAGTVWINEHTTLTGAPFGGFKESGVGRELGREDVKTFTECQTMLVPATNGSKQPEAKRAKVE